MTCMNIQFSFFLLCIVSVLYGQDTFSIVAVDPLTGEVGSAGASCVNAVVPQNFSGHQIGELFPGVGAINTQAYYLLQNQSNARDRMNMGEAPDEIINWLIDNDIENNPTLRQYGIAGFDNGLPMASAHTGVNCDPYANHIVGLNYAIAGNIILDQSILDNMEAKFINATGDLASKLMAALQGANVPGADRRCAPNGTSSLFAYIKVAKPDDVFGNPSFFLDVETTPAQPPVQGYDPIDSLQTLYNNTLAISPDLTLTNEMICVLAHTFPDKYVLTGCLDNYTIRILDAEERIVQQHANLSNYFKIENDSLSIGLYFIQVIHNVNRYMSFQDIIKYD